MKRWRRSCAPVLSSLVLLFALLAGSMAAEAAPGQFIAKMYTDALGRAPDPNGWEGWINWFNSSGCNRTTLEQSGQAFFGAEYAGLGYDNTEKVLTLYRAILSREPDSGYGYWVGVLNGGTPLSSVVSSFFAFPEFVAKVTTICGGGSYGFSGWALDNSLVPLGSSGFSGTQAQLQAALNAAPPGGAVILAQRAVIYLTSPLVIPAGKGLATSGLSWANPYAKMARLVRASAFSGPMVQVEPGARLYTVNISGQRQAFSPVSQDYAMNVMAYGSGGQVANVHSETPLGRGMMLFGAREMGTVCALDASYNVLTNYTGSHTDWSWADGIGVACEAATLYSNGIVDATDVGLIFFNTLTAQSGLAYGNVIISAGLPGYGGLMVSPAAISGTQVFNGVNLQQNFISTSDTTHFDIAVPLGSKPWNAANPVGNSSSGTSVLFQNNTIIAIVQSGLVIDGMLNVNVQGNSVFTWWVGFGRCPYSPIRADVPTDASGVIQAYTAGPTHSCIDPGI